MNAFKKFFYKGSVKTSTVVPNTEFSEKDIKTESFRPSITELTTMDKVDIVIESEKENSKRNFQQNKTN